MCVGGIGDMIGGGFQFAGSLTEGIQTADAIAAERNREVERASVAIEGAHAKGSYETGRQRILNAQLAGKQKQAYTAAGVDATQGTAAAVQADSQALGELDAQQLAINAAREVYGYKMQKKQAYEVADLREAQNSTKATMGTVGGLTKIASGFVSAGMGGGK